MNFTDGSSSTQGHYLTIFTDTTTLTYHIFMSFQIINLFFGLPANCYIVWLILTGKGAGFVSEFFSLNLAICEIFYCLGSVFSLLGFIHLQGFMSVMPIYARPLFLCLICVERYVAVVHPIMFLKCKPLRYRLACSAVVWVILAGLGVFCMFILSTNNMYMFICIVLPQYLLLFVIKLFCCLAVLWTLKNPGPGEKSRQREENNQLKRRAIIVILILSVAMVVNYAPFLISGILYNYLSVNEFSNSWICGVCIAMLIAFVQPFMYIHRFGNLALISRIFHSLTSLKL